MSKLIFLFVQHSLCIDEEDECEDQEELHFARHRPRPVHAEFIVSEEIVDVEDVPIPKSIEDQF
jgi:hypothetical protein